MPPRKKKAPKKVVKQKQKQRQSVVVNINQQRKTVARQPSQPKPVQPVQPSTSFNPMINFPQYDNTSSIISAIKASLNKQPEIVRDVARVDVAEQVATPLRERERASRIARFTPQISGLAMEEVQTALPQEPQPESIPEAFVSVGGRPEPLVSVESGGRREPEKRLVSFNLGAGRFETSELPETRFGILQSQKQPQFPVPRESALYVPEPVELRNPRPIEPSDTIRESLSGGAEEPPSPPPRATQLKDNIQAHNQAIKDNYKSQGRTDTDARKDPNYIYLTQKGRSEGSKPVAKSDKQLVEELRQKELLGLIPPSSQLPITAFLDEKGTKL